MRGSARRILAGGTQKSNPREPGTGFQPTLSPEFRMLFPGCKLRVSDVHCSLHSLILLITGRQHLCLRPRFEVSTNAKWPSTTYTS